MKEDNQFVILAPIHFVWSLALIFIHHDYAQIALAVNLVVVAVTHGGDKTFLPRQYNYVLYAPTIRPKHWDCLVALQRFQPH